jgi:4-hydroxybenzoate polyprenyltransferase
MPPALKLLRPKQWIKNGFVFAPLCFSGKFTEAEAWGITLTATLYFLCIACIVYVVNDLRDVAEDRLHPVKKNRPIAAGKVTPLQAGIIACGLAAVAAYLATMLPLDCTWVALSYLVLNVFYTFYLKNIAIVDIFFVSSCYVLRVLMGGYALQVVISPWIVLATFLLALFLSAGKRHHEVGFEEYARTKPNLQHYNRNLLDRMLTISGSAALLTYAIYAAEVAERIGRMEMIYTVGFVAFGLFRYLQSIYVYGKGGEPETVLLKDKMQLLNLALWLVTTLAIMF